MELYGDIPIEFEFIDGEIYANATQICQSFGKRIAEWGRLEQTQRYVSALRAKWGSPTPLTISKSGGIGGGGSTWVHEKLLVKLNQWIDVDFDIWCSEVIAKVIRERSNPVEATPVPSHRLTHAESLRAYANEIEAHERTKLQLAEAQPKVEQYERTMNAGGTYEVADVAKMIGTGRNRLFTFLSAEKKVFRHREHWQPYQDFVDSGDFIVRQTSYKRGNKDASYPKLFVTPKGVESIRRWWDKRHMATNLQS